MYGLDETRLKIGVKEKGSDQRLSSSIFVRSYDEESRNVKFWIHIIWSSHDSFVFSFNFVWWCVVSIVRYIVVIPYNYNTDLFQNLNLLKFSPPIFNFGADE